MRKNKTMLARIMAIALSLTTVFSVGACKASVDIGGGMISIDIGGGVGNGNSSDSGNSGNSGNSGSNTTKPATTEAATTPTTNAPTTEENPSEEKSGCGSSVAGGFALVMTVGAAGAMLVRRKKD